MKYDEEPNESRLTPEAWLDKQIEAVSSLCMSVELELAEAADQNSPERFRLLQEFTVLGSRAFNLVELSAVFAENQLDGVIRIFDTQCALMNQQLDSNQKTQNYMSPAGKLISQTMIKENEAKLADTAAFKLRLESNT